MTNSSAVARCDVGVTTTITIIIASVCSDRRTAVSATRMRAMVVVTVE